MAIQSKRHFETSWFTDIFFSFLNRIYVTHFSYYFFETNETPLLEIFYLVYAVAVYILINVFLAKNVLFIHICAYVVAMYDELQLELSNIDEVNRKKRTAKIKECVRMHMDILG